MAVFETLEPTDPRQVGRYRIVARLGAGGMGQVYLARSPGGRPVAVKTVRPDLARDDDFRRRFAREVTAARRVNGAFTAGVVDADTDGSTPWLATVYVPGASLGEAIAGHGPWPVRPVLALGAGLAEALEAIHAAGVFHRDLKPSNILLATDGPRVIDFGISVATDASALTHTGMMIGTPGFMSPEQLTGQKVGPASDVFALGAVLVYTATGVGPFGTGTPHALHYRVVHEPPHLDALPPELRSIVAACLAKDPDQRPTVVHLLDRLTPADGAEDGGGETAAATLLAEPGWMPDQVARLVQAHTSASLPHTPPTLPDTQSPAPALLPSSPPPAIPRPDPATPASAPSAALSPPSAQPPRTVPPAMPGPAAGPADLSPRLHGLPPRLKHPISRRGVLLGLAGTALTAGTFTAWKILDSNTPDRLWKLLTGDYVGSSPTVAAGVVYVGSDLTLYAVDAATGKERWSFPTGDHVQSSPTVAAGVVYVGSDDGKLYAVNAATGKEHWSFPTGFRVDSSPTVAARVVYVGNNDGKLYAVNAATGKEHWSFPTGDYVQSSPTVAAGVVYVGSGDGNLYAVNATTGKEHWSFPTGDAVDSSPTVAAGVVYVGSGDGNLYAVNATTGKEHWSFPTGDRVHSSPTVAAGVVHVGSGDGNLYAVNATTGEERWSFPAGDGVYSSPTVASGVVYVGSSNGKLYAVNAATGKERWSFPTGDAVDSSPTVTAGVVYVGSDDGNLYAVQT